MDNIRRNELIIQFSSAMEKLRTSNVTAESDIYKCMKEQLKDKMNLGRIKLAVYHTNSLAALDTSELYLVCDQLKKFCSEKNKVFDVDFAEYFTPEEISTAKLLRKAESDSPILRMRAMQKGTINNPEWIGIMSYEEIVDASKRGLLKYNMSTQRVAKVYIIDGRTNFIPDIDEKTVDSIAQAIIEGRFEPNTITLNILKKDDEPYNNLHDEMNVLIIDAEENEVDIIDGMHRIKGIVKAWQMREKQIIDGEETEQISGQMAVCVKNLSEEQAKTFIHQESLANTQQKNTKLLYSPDSYLAQFFIKLNRARGSVVKNPYYGRISFYADDSSIISTAFLASFMSDMNVILSFDRAIQKESALVEAVDNFVSFANMVYEELKDRDDYKRYKRIFEGQCFMAGMLVYFISNMEKLDVDSETRSVFVETINSLNPNSFIFDYPLLNKQIRELKRIFK